MITIAGGILLAGVVWFCGRIVLGLVWEHLNDFSNAKITERKK